MITVIPSRTEIGTPPGLEHTAIAEHRRFGGGRGCRLQRGNACFGRIKKSGIQNFRFHDLRHSAASYLAMNGASIAEIAEVLGHKTLQMVKRYAHLSEAHTSSVVERMNKKIFG